jgi:hypothetical protein
MNDRDDGHTIDVGPVTVLGPPLARITKRPPGQVTLAVLANVAVERRRQDEKWGEQNHPDGTGPDREFIDLDTLDGDEDFQRDGFITHQGAANLFRDICKANGPAEDNYRDILMEEVAEAFAEMDPIALRTELIQVAAVAVQWVEAIDRRAVLGETDAALPLTVGTRVTRRGESLPGGLPPSVGMVRGITPGRRVHVTWGMEDGEYDEQDLQVVEETDGGEPRG